MIRFRTHPVFGSLALTAVAVIAGEGWMLGTQRAAAVKAIAQLERQEQERQALAAANPYPDATNAAKLAAALASNEQEFAARRSELLERKPASWPLAPLPATSMEAYFDLASFIEQAREKARVAGVALRSDESFGFSAYIHQGPSPDLIASVFGERQIIGCLIDTLFAVHPKRLLSVQREPARSATGGKAGEASTGTPDPDLFELDLRQSARMPGLVEATAFRLSFTGQTSTLRGFLNKLADLALPLIVRGIEVEPAAESAGEGQSFPSGERELPEAKNSASARANVPLAIVAQNLSRFTVTIEYLEPVDSSVPVS